MEPSSSEELFYFSPAERLQKQSRSVSVLHLALFVRKKSVEKAYPDCPTCFASILDESFQLPVF